jgi:predicted Zn-dependent peptidase
VDEKIGTTGIAHMFEHMAFKGTRHIGTSNFRAEKPILDEIERLGGEMAAEQAKPSPDTERITEIRKAIAGLQQKGSQYVVKDELWDTYLRHGAEDLNASTGKDTTNYYVSLPANRMELWALMESQRMQEPVFREFYPERDVVTEERRMRTETSPDGKLYELLISTAFQAHPQRLPILGWMSDIQSLTIADAGKFHNVYYTPNNSVCAIVGDFDVEEIKGLIHRYFAPIRRGPEPPPIVTVEPEQEGERRVYLNFDAGPQVLIAYHKPTMPNPDADVLDLLSGILTEGRTARLYRRLVRDDRIASNVYSFEAPGSRYDNVLVFGAVPIQPHTPAEIESAIYAEFDRLASEGPTEREMEKMRNQRRMEFLEALESNMGLANQLSWFECVTGDWRFVLEYLERIEAINPEDVRNAAKKYLTPSNRTVATLVTEKPE